MGMKMKIEPIINAPGFTPKLPAQKPPSFVPYALFHKHVSSHPTALLVFNIMFVVIFIIGFITLC